MRFATSRLSLLRVGLCSAALAPLLLPCPAAASFHLAHIERLLSSLNSSTDVQFVQIEMDAAGQNLVAGSKLLAFADNGSFSHVVLTVPSKVDSGAGASWLMASTAFEAETGMAPDFVFDSSDGKGLPAKSGMVCWGKPADQTNPDDPSMIDCVSYGNYSGPDNSHTEKPIAIPPFGHGLQRLGDSGSSANDFACEEMTTPITNEPDKRAIDATSPCTGCGNGALDDDEKCDDADPVFTPGDACSVDCVPYPCGIPTKVDGEIPKTGDALFALRAAVKTARCDLAVCDVNSSKSITTSDALLILKRAVGQAIVLSCP